jgi:hypothetical protein
MTQNQIKETQEKVGTVPDGFWGPKSIAACQRHLRKLMPPVPQWPKSDQSSLTAFYGAPGDESKLTNLDVTGLGVKYEGKTVKTIRCHAKVAGSLHWVLSMLSDTHPLILAEYAGVYNNRVMRGGTMPSLHARGAAIDLWPDRNGNRQHWPTQALMPLEVMEAFSREGWLSAGAFWSRDAMHFQATQ